MSARMCVYTFLYEHVPFSSRLGFQHRLGVREEDFDFKASELFTRVQENQNQ